MNPADHFILAPDASQITDKRTGTSWDTRDVMKTLFAKEPDMYNTNRHPMLAHDQSSMPVRGGQSYSAVDQDPGSAEISGTDCLQFVRLCLAKLSGPDREDFLMGLTDLVSTEDPNAGGQDGTLELRHGNGNGRNGVPKNNQGALDRTKSGRRPARDNRRPAQDSALRGLQTSNFNKRWGHLTENIRFGGTGR
jgi:hypothetical protein